MSLRRFLRLVLPPLVFALGRRLRRLFGVDPARRFARRGSMPWSDGYFGHRARLVTGTLDDAELMRRFRAGEPLPEGYAVAVDERAVEYPWVFSRLGEKRLPQERCLDAGSALNHDFLVERPELRERELHILTLAPEAACFWRQGISYLFADLRDLPARDGYYDTVISISTLEHVGHDNSLFAAAQENTPAGDFKVAVSELWRVLRPGGRLLLTVPYGRRQRFPAFQQFDAALLEELITTLPTATVASLERAFYLYGATGWNVATASACADASYVPWIMRSPAERGPFPDHADRAAAARAVACLLITKAGPRNGT